MPYFIFDMDGTLLDSMWVWRCFGARFLKSRGITPPPDIVSLARSYGPYRLANRLIADYRLNDTEESIIDWIWEDILFQYRHHVVPKPGVREFLQSCKKRGFPMAIATSTARDISEEVLQRLGLRDFFTTVRSCKDFHTEKHLPDIYLRCLADLGGKKEQAVVFEDAYYAAKTVRQAGMYLVGIAEELEVNEAGVKEMADQFITRYEDLDWGKLPK